MARPRINALLGRLLYEGGTIEVVDSNLRVYAPPALLDELRKGLREEKAEIVAFLERYDVRRMELESGDVWLLAMDKRNPSEWRLWFCGREGSRALE